MVASAEMSRGVVCSGNHIRTVTLVGRRVALMRSRGPADRRRFQVATYEMTSNTEITVWGFPILAGYRLLYLSWL